VFRCHAKEEVGRRGALQMYKRVLLQVYSLVVIPKPHPGNPSLPT
jgi:hypothetical protein